MVEYPQSSLVFTRRNLFSAAKGASAMVYHVTEICISCGACAAQCPTRAITLEERAVIHPELCIGCGICADICPVNAPRRVKQSRP